MLCICNLLFLYVIICIRNSLLGKFEINKQICSKRFKSYRPWNNLVRKSFLKWPPHLDCENQFPLGTPQFKICFSFISRSFIHLHRDMVRTRKMAHCLRAGMAQWWEHSPPTNVARVRFPDSATHVGWVCWFSALKCLSPGTLVFPSRARMANKIGTYRLYIPYSTVQTQSMIPFIHVGIWF